MSKRLTFLFLVTAACLCAQAPAPAGPSIPVIGDPTELTEAYRLLVGQWMTTGQQWQSGIFFTLALLDLSWMAMTLWLDRHSMETGLLAATKKLITLCFFLMLLVNGGTWLPGLINGFVTLGKQASGVPSLAPSSILQMGVNIAGTLLWSAAKSALFMNHGAAIAIVFGAGLVFFAFLGLTAMFIVAQVQIYLAIGFASFFAAFGGSRWTVPYVEKLFSLCVSSGVYLMSMYLLIGAAWPITNSWKARAASSGSTMGGLMDGWIIGGSAVLYLFVAWFVARHVSATLGGAPTLSGSDATAFVGGGVATAMGIASMATTGGTSAVAQGAVVAASAMGGSSGASGPGGTASVPPRPGPSGPTGGGGGNAVAPPRSSSGSNGSSGSVGSTLAAVGKMGAGALQRLPHNGHSASPPPLRGIDH